MPRGGKGASGQLYGHAPAGAMRHVPQELGNAAPAFAMICPATGGNAAAPII
jgi:hypothetical protein